jgi:hypothetical protein
MVGEVGAVLLARDDHESHLELALPFLEAATPVFVDKPLALNPSDLRILASYLDQGLLMSCSAMRFAPVVAELAKGMPALGPVRLLSGTNVLGWEKYGIHILEAIFTLVKKKPLAVVPLPAAHEACAVELDDGGVVVVNCLGVGAVVFQVSVFGEAGHSTIDITDNFSMFRATLQAFHHQVVTGDPAIPPEQTLELMAVLRAGRRALMEKRRIELHDVAL